MSTRRGAPVVPFDRFAPPARRGVHLLHPAEARRLVRRARVGPRDLVLDLGAGAGALTAPLADTGARVLAVEVDRAFVRLLEARFASCSAVRVVHADARTMALPTRPFRVVANIPFALTTPLLGRLLDPAGTALSAADLVVEWGVARRLAAAVPRDARTLWWAARFELLVVGRIDRTSFRPAPRVDAAHLSIRARPGLHDRHTLAALRVLLRHRDVRQGRVTVGRALEQLVPPRRAHRLARATGLDPPVPADLVTAAQWAALACAVTSSRP